MAYLCSKCMDSGDCVKTTKNKAFCCPGGHTPRLPVRVNNSDLCHTIHKIFDDKMDDMWGAPMQSVCELNQALCDMCSRKYTQDHTVSCASSLPHYVELAASRSEP